MTTVVCNKEEMACDLQFTNLNTGMKFKGKTKIYKFNANPLTYNDCDFMVGFAGSASDVIAVAEFFSMPEAFDKPPKVSGMGGLVLTQKGDIFTFDHYSKWLMVNQEYMSIGSGSLVALGAVAAGSSPKEAIKIASKLDAYTGMGIKVLRW